MCKEWEYNFSKTWFEVEKKENLAALQDYVSYVLESLENCQNKL